MNRGTASAVIAVIAVAAVLALAVFEATRPGAEVPPRGDAIAEKEAARHRPPAPPPLRERLFDAMDGWPAPPGVHTASAFWLGFGFAVAGAAVLATGERIVRRRLRTTGALAHPGREAILLAVAGPLALFATLLGLFLVLASFSSEWGR